MFFSENLAKIIITLRPVAFHFQVGEGKIELSKAGGVGRRRRRG